jgi:hypothetical protein
MPNTYSLPGTMSHDRNGNVTIESLHGLTFFSLGDVKPEHTTGDAKTPWGWLSPALPGHTNSFCLPASAVSYGSHVLSPSNIRRSFEGIEIRRRGSRYIANTGRVDYWRDWEYCSSTDSAKQTLGLATLFQIVRQSKDQDFTKYRSEAVSDSTPSGVPFYVPAQDMYRYPRTVTLNSRAGRALGDSDSTLELEYFNNDSLVDNAATIRAFNGEQHSVAVGHIMRNTGFAVVQSRDVIEQFARARVAKKRGVAETTLAQNDNDVTATRQEYNATLIAFQKNTQLTGNITNDIAALRGILNDATKCPADSVQRDVTQQMLTEYEAVQSNLQALRNNPKIKDLEGFKFIHNEHITPDMMMQLSYWPHTKDLFFSVPSDKGQNAGFLFMTRFSGFNESALNTMWNPADSTAAVNLSRSLRFMGTNSYQLMQQGLFNPNDVGEHRDAVIQSMVDLPGMIRTLLVPGAADLPENAAYLSTAYRAQFVDPRNTVMQRRVALQRLATAFDNGGDYVHIDQLKMICDAMSSGNYDPKLANMGITRSDFNDIRRLLTDGVSPEGIPREMTTLYNGFVDLMKKHGHGERIMDKTDFLMATAAIDIQYNGPEVRFGTLDGFGRRDFSVSVFQQNTHYGHAQTLRLAQRARERQDILEPVIPRLVRGPVLNRFHNNDSVLCLAPSERLFALSTPFQTPGLSVPGPEFNTNPNNPLQQVRRDLGRNRNLYRPFAMM